MSVCGKKTHPDEASAREHMAELRADSNDHPVRLAKLKVYFCRVDNGWHVGHNRSAASAENARRRHLRKARRR
jgi:hypothetical protein